MDETLAAARRGDNAAFEALVAPYHADLRAHCYRMLGSVHDADDALREALSGAWRGLAGHEGRASLRSWLYRVTTSACLRLGGRRRRRILATEYAPPRTTAGDLGTPITDAAFVEPYPTDPADRYELLESVELAFVAALQHLPGSQRAVLILREVLAFSAEEVAVLLGTTVPAVNSAMQRALAALRERGPAVSQQRNLAALGERGRAELVGAFVDAWQRADGPALLDLLVADARFTMPPLPAWFEGREQVGDFLRERLFIAPWRLLPVHANGQLAFACYRDSALAALNVLTVRDGKIEEISGFADPAMFDRFDLPTSLPPDR